MKTKLLSIFMISIFLFSCSSQKLTDQQVTDTVKTKFQLTENDKIEIIGIAQEDKNTSVVKLKLNNEDFTVKMKKYDRGLQLDEVKNELGAWISADLVAKMFDHSEEQKWAMADISTISIIITSYMTDNGEIPDMNGEYDRYSKFYETMVPLYIPSLPTRDPWGNNYLIYSKVAANGKYGFKDATSLDFIVVSLGKDGISESDQDFVSEPSSGYSVTSNYDIDLVMLNGTWIRAPKK